MPNQSLAEIRTTIEETLGESPYITDLKVERVGNDLQVWYHLLNASQSGFEVRNQHKRGHSTANRFELVNANLVVPAPETFDDDNPFNSADEYADTLYSTVQPPGVAPPGSAAAPNMDAGRMITIPHNNHGGNIEAYLNWVTAVANHIHG